MGGPVALRLHLDPSAPLYRQIVDGIAGAVARGELAGGSPLPSVRELAETLGINPNTVQKAYRDLQREGLVQPRPGNGMFVHPDAARLAEVRERLIAAAIGQALSALAAYGLGPEDVVARIRAWRDGEEGQDGRGD